MSTPYTALLKVKYDTVLQVSKTLKQSSIRRHKATWFNMAVMGLLYLTENKDTEQLGLEFGVCESSVRNYVDKVVAALGMMLPTGYTDLTAALHENNELLLDGSFFHQQNSYRKGFWSYKHKSCGVNVQFLTDLTGKPVWFSPSYPGSIPDVKAAQMLDIAGAAHASGSVVYADKGYVGLDKNRVGDDVNSICALSKIYRNTGVEVKQMNRVISQVRRPVETLFARLKNYKVLRHFRRRLERFDDTLRAVVSLHILEGKTW